MAPALSGLQRLRHEGPYGDLGKLCHGDRFGTIEDNMLVIVTGDVGVGKTTVCGRVIALAREAGRTCGGVISRKTGGGDILAEDIGSARSMPLASTRPVHSGPQTGKYWFSPAGIRFGNDAIRRGTSCGILVVDELGPLELEGEGFSCAAQTLRRRRVRDSVIVIRSELLVPFLPLLGRAACIFRTTARNRDVLPEQIWSLLGDGAASARRRRKTRAKESAAAHAAE